RDGVFMGFGYSGHPPDGVNNPAKEDVANVGPIPRGKWYIGQFVDKPHLGPCVAPLIPDSSTQTFGRSGFYIHGDNAQGNHSASDGCIILAPTIREQIKASGIHAALFVE